MTNCEHPLENNGGGIWKKHMNSSYENLITGELTSGQPSFHKGGILADDMGLGKCCLVHFLTRTESLIGKTIEVIAVMLRSYEESINWVQSMKNRSPIADVQINDHDPALMPTKGTLIVCPLSTVSNWEEQIQAHVKRGTLSVYVYHGAARCQDPRVLSKFVSFHFLSKSSAYFLERCSYHI